MGKPIRSCAVDGCIPASKTRNVYVKYYRFPRENDFAKRWLEKCHSKDKLNLKNARICEKHFSKEQKGRFLKYELLKSDPPARFRDLKQDAVPDLHLPEHRPTRGPRHQSPSHDETPLQLPAQDNGHQLPSTSQQSSSGFYPYSDLDFLVQGPSGQQAMQEESAVIQGAHDHSDEMESNLKTATVNHHMVMGCIHLPHSSHTSTSEDVNDCQYTDAEIAAAEMLADFSQHHVTSSQLSVSAPITDPGTYFSSVDLAKTVEQLKQELVKKDAEYSIIQEKLQQATETLSTHKVALGKCFTANQVKCLLSGKPIAKWQEEDIVSALTLRSLSLGTYRYLRKHMNFPLPCVSTIDRWVSDINVEPGLLNSVLRMMHIRGKLLTTGEKACILSFDEMKVASKYSYDKGADKIYKPHTTVQVAMVQGIISNWKQPVFYDFDTPMKMLLLNHIISSIEMVGFPVHATVCDMSGANQGLLKTLGVNVTNASFINPVQQDRKVHVFADVPHLVKLVRNNLLDSGIDTPFGKVTSAPLFEVERHQSGDFKYASKLSKANLHVKGPQCQRVKTAVHLLSETVAKALEYLGNKNLLKSDWRETSKFINLVDMWFDLLNSSSITSDKPQRSPYKASTHQVNTLNTMIKVFQNSTVNGKVNPFMKGIVISSTPLQNLFVDMKHLYSISYLLTRRLNQDVLENAFGILRQMAGAHDHPDPVSMKYRMRRYILSRKHVLVSVNTNTDIIKDSSFMAEGIKQFSKLSSPIKKLVGEDHSDFNDISDDWNTGTACRVNTMDNDLVQEDDEFTVPSQEVDGFRYVLGFEAHKFKKKYPFLCSFEKENYWITCKDRGGLQRMSKDDADQFKKLEKHFVERHKVLVNNEFKDLLIEESGAVSVLTKLALPDVEGIPMDVIEYYFRCRIYFRIRRLNRSLAAENFRQKVKKMKKVVN